MKRGLAVLLLAVLLLAAREFREQIWGPSGRELSRRREDLAARYTVANLRVALVMPDSSGSDAYVVSKAFRDGAKMAAEEINGTGGVKLYDAETGKNFYRPLLIEVHDAPEFATAKNYVYRSIVLARRIAADPTVVAVMGHSDEAMIAASAVYKAAGLLYFASTNSDPALTRHGDAPFVFGISPSDEDVAKAMVGLIPAIVRKKDVHVLLLYPKSKARRARDDPAKRLKESAAKLIQDDRVDFQVVGHAYDPDSLDYREDLKRLLDTPHFNVVMIADLSRAAAMLREQIETMWAEKSGNKADVYQPKILDLGQLNPNSEANSISWSVPALSADFDFENMVRIIREETRQNAVVLFEREQPDPFEQFRVGKRLGTLLKERMEEFTVNPLYKLNVVLARSYDWNGGDFTQVVDEVARAPVDFVFVTGSTPPAMELVKQLRRANMEKPVICSPDPFLDVTLEITPGYTPESLGETYEATIFDPWSDDPRVRRFLKDFRAYVHRGGAAAIEDVEMKFSWAAAYGYVSVRLLKDAFEGAQSASPRKAANYARLYGEIDGPLGKNRFDRKHRDLLGVPIIFQRLDFRDAQHIIRLPRP